MSGLVGVVTQLLAVTNHFLSSVSFFSKSHNLSTIITVIIVMTTPFLANYFISFHINYDTT